MVTSKPLKCWTRNQEFFKSFLIFVFSKVSYVTSAYSMCLRTFAKICWTPLVTAHIFKHFLTAIHYFKCFYICNPLKPHKNSPVSAIIICILQIKKLKNREVINIFLQRNTASELRTRIQTQSTWEPMLTAIMLYDPANSKNPESIVVQLIMRMPIVQKIISSSTDFGNC